MLAHAGDFKGKVVLDIGAGTGVLSIFAARAGAARVYAVEASDFAARTRAIVAANGLSDVITVLQTTAEEAELPEQVDVIVSEWMGYALIYETMFPSVIAARDRWLKPGGSMYPSHATVCLLPFGNDTHGVMNAFWPDVHGIDMSCLVPDALRQYLAEPIQAYVDEGDLLTTRPAIILDFDCLTATAAEVQRVWSVFSFTAECDHNLSGFAVYFDTAFRSGCAPDLAADAAWRALVHERIDPTMLSTSPWANKTHWFQTLLYLDQEEQVKKGERISGSLRMVSRPDFPRHLCIDLTHSVSPPLMASKEDGNNAGAEGGKTARAEEVSKTFWF